MSYLKANFSARTFEKRIAKLFLAVALAFLVLGLLTFAGTLVLRLTADTSRRTLPEIEQFPPARHLLM
jgi:CHASE3 domain sensor protein